MITRRENWNEPFSPHPLFSFILFIICLEIVFWFFFPFSLRGTLPFFSKKKYSTHTVEKRIKSNNKNK